MIFPVGEIGNADPAGREGAAGFAIGEGIGDVVRLELGDGIADFASTACKSFEDPVRVFE